MPPILALGAYGLLVLILLGIERRSEPYSSWGLLLPTTWVLLAASRPLGNWFAPTAGSFEEGSPIDRLVLTVLICLGVMLLAKRRGASRPSLAAYSPLFLLYGFLAVSILWSDYPFVSLKRWVKCVGALPIGFLLLTEQDPVAALTKMLRRVAYVLIPFSLLLIKYFPSQGRGYGRWSGTEMWLGVTTTKNSLGQLCLMAILTLAWASLRGLRSRETPIPRQLLAADVFVVLLAIYLMIGTPSGAYSATSLAALVLVTGAVGVMFKFRRSAQRIAVILCVGVIVGWLGMAFAESFVSEASSLLGRDETLTGRTEIWSMALADASARPVLGTGFGGYFNTNNEFSRTHGYTAHNGILDVYVETGIVGVVVLLVFLFSAFIDIRKSLDGHLDFGVLALAILLTNLLANYTESIFLKSTSYVWTMLLFVSIMATSAFWTVSLASEEASVDARSPAARRSVRRNPRSSGGTKGLHAHGSQPRSGRAR